MVQILAITDYINSLATAEVEFGITQTTAPSFFPEWLSDLPPLTTAEQQKLDLIKQRYLYHRQYGHLLEGAVNFIVIAPLLELAGFYDPPFHLRSEASVRVEFADKTEQSFKAASMASCSKIISGLF